MAAKTIMTSEEIRRALIRIGHEIVERNQGHEDLVFIGMRTRGVPLAHRISKAISAFEGAVIAVGAIDISLYRDDLSSRREIVLQPTDIPVDIEGKRLILVDDVLFTGRSIRAAMDELIDFGRPKSIQLAVLVDRGHRELPIRADYVGRNVPTSIEEEIRVCLKETDDRDEVLLVQGGGQVNDNDQR